MRSNTHVLQPRADVFVRLYRIRPGSSLLPTVQEITRRVARRNIVRIGMRTNGDYLVVTFIRPKLGS